MSEPKQHKWGYEISWTKTNHYEGNFLVFEKTGAKTDVFLDTSVDKSWFVNTGKFKLRWINTDEGKFYEQDLKEGDTFEVTATTPVQLCSLVDNSTISEIKNLSVDNKNLILMDSTLIG